MSWQEAFLNKIHFNAFLAAIAVVGAWFWFSNKIVIAGISALIIALYFFFLLIIYLTNNYKINVYLEQQNQINLKYQEEQWQTEKTKVEFWYAAASPMLRSNLRELLTFDMVGNNPLARVCHRERGEYFGYDSFSFIFPGFDCFREKYAITHIQIKNGNDIFYIHPHLYSLLTSAN